VLLYGKMRELALYRAEVLSMRGFDVIVPRNNGEAVQAILAGGFQVAVLSYTLANGTVKEMSELIRQQCPGCPLLMISQHAEDDPHIQPDAIVQAELGPAALVETIHRTLQRRLQ
jgi:DNA-binding response OmpR family regulator